MNDKNGLSWKVWGFYSIGPTTTQVQSLRTHIISMAAKEALNPAPNMKEMKELKASVLPHV
ncbi:hypothetical protein AB5E31_005006 [Salmonella enterica]|nr:hypothetical protein [Salmonella enterica]EBP3873955.1 hypothetical protein [Salmonella enterica subsp. enterica]ECL9689262.1 hypothetical protein [Salmonella enterica subsp. enterica serovar Rubislaw]EDD0024237.1 hypothetical protein [Salmonella enterica subsp. enterica serovar Give]EDT1357855.1 hypothetical protein [Salmonella enterica subsp. enterica serovar Braenderup]EDT1749214.1 hypothetical protein [Salmonella enterica subsp. enterica serovar Berta]EDU1831533.1 hypothetical protein 